MASARPAPRTLALPLFDPLRPFRPRPKRPVANGIPRISLPGVTAPFPVTPRRPPAPDDPLDATRLALRLQALGAALDDLPATGKALRPLAGAKAGRPHAPRLAAASGPPARPAPRQAAHARGVRDPARPPRPRLRRPGAPRHVVTRATAERDERRQINGRTAGMQGAAMTERAFSSPPCRGSEFRQQALHFPNTNPGGPEFLAFRSGRHRPVPALQRPSIQ